QIQSNVNSTNVSNSDDSDSNGSQSENAIDSEQPVLRNIAKVKTRWNSKYHSWKRLLKLRKAIEWLCLTLPLSDDSNDGADG
ncbi:22181_t:CDS:1, partial [Gigaspora rosea]